MGRVQPAPAPPTRPEDPQVVLPVNLHTHATTPRNRAWLPSPELAVSPSALSAGAPRRALAATCWLLPGEVGPASTCPGGRGGEGFWKGELGSVQTDPGLDSGCVTLGRLLRISGPHFPYL